MKFVVDKNIPFMRESLSVFGDVTMLETGTITPESVRDADVLIVRSETNVGKPLLEQSRVQFVGTTTIGIDHIDCDYLNSRHIAFANAPGSNANAVKEYFVAGLLYLSNLHGFNLHGKTIGIVGVGNVGKKIVQAAEILGLHVVKNDPPLARLTGDQNFVPLEALADCDILSLHVPLTKTGNDPTYHLFGIEQFRKLKPGVIFINTSRGGVVEMAALKNAIREKKISFSMIDVWENEPAIDQELLSMVTLGTAHIAGHSFDGKVNAWKMVYDQMCSYFSLTSTWTPEMSGLRQGLSAVNLPSNHLRTEEVLHHIVSQSYDIAFDDKQLRQLLQWPESQRKEYFQKLRTDYRIRRECSNVTVNLPSRFSSMKEQLNSLGFTCTISKD